jgi:hypothetical protein
MNGQKYEAPNLQHVQSNYMSHMALLLWKLSEIGTMWTIPVFVSYEGK